MLDHDLSISVVVPTWRRAEPLQRNLEALIGQVPPPDEIIVVGREEDEGAQEVVRRSASMTQTPIRWVEVDRPGHVAPIQRGAEAAAGSVTAFLDDDVEAQPGWLAAVVRPFAQPGVSCVGGRVVDASAVGRSRPAPEDAGTIRWYGRLAANVSWRLTDGAVAVDVVQESNWAWRTSVLRGLSFDPVLDFDDASMYGLDLCMQAKALGGAVVYDSAAAVVDHPAPRDPSLDRSDRAPRVFAYCRNYTYILLKHRRGWDRAIFLAWWWLIGERGSYGVLKGTADLLRGGGQPVWELIRASFRGRAEGVRQWRHRSG